MIAEEIWKDIKGYEGSYQISNLGRAKSFKSKTEKIMRFSKAGRNYDTICLMQNGKVNRQYIHRLVAIHFLENPTNLREVNHKDGNKQNNNVNNLEWVSLIDNLKHAREVLGFVYRGEKHYATKLKDSDIVDIIKKYRTGNYTYKQLSSIYNIGDRGIQKIVTRKRWSHVEIN